MYMVTLEAARVNAGLSRKEAAEQLGIHVSTLANWEKGKTSPDIARFKQLCSLYRCPGDLIFLPKKFTLSEYPSKNPDTPALP